MQTHFFGDFDQSFYQPRPISCFEPTRIVLTRGWNRTESSRGLTERILALYDKIVPEDCSNIAHPKVPIQGVTPLQQHFAGKQTLVIGEHQSAVRLSSEEGNTCPNYWHFSLYGFCPYGCTYCYLAGTPGVKFSPSVKIFVNIDDILDGITKQAKKFDKPTAFYHGKLQDGLALDPLSGYMKKLVPFFAEQKYARMVLLTKSADIENLLDLDHAGHTILSWTLHPPDISAVFEPNTPPVNDRIEAMQRCVKVGYPVRAVVMPLVPVENWVEKYNDFLKRLLAEIPLQRLTIGAICSYHGACDLMNRKLGMENPINREMRRQKENDGRIRSVGPTADKSFRSIDESSLPLVASGLQKQNDGRIRYSESFRESGYKHLIDTAKRIRPDLEIGLCLETRKMFQTLGIEESLGKCNCVL